MGCASSTRTLSATERLGAELDASAAMHVDACQFDGAPVDDDTRVPASLYYRLRRRGAQAARAGSHVRIFDAKGSQRLRQPHRGRAARATAFAMGEAVCILGFVSLAEALGSALIGTVQSICDVAEDGKRYRLFGLGIRWFEEAELEACGKVCIDDLRPGSAAPPSVPATPPVTSTLAAGDALRAAARSQLPAERPRSSEDVVMVTS